MGGSTYFCCQLTDNIRRGSGCLCPARDWLHPAVLDSNCSVQVVHYPATNLDTIAKSVAQHMQCAEQFPNSPFAAESLKKVIDYYCKKRDFPRAAELLERVCQDYQDQDWLHTMLLTWGKVHYHMRNREACIDKFRQVIEEYPGSDSAEQASRLLKKLEK